MHNMDADEKKRWAELQEKNRVYLHCCECDAITAHADDDDDPIFVRAYVCLTCGIAWEAEIPKEKIN